MEKKLCAALLRLAATRHWGTLTLDIMARAAKVPVATVTKRFADKTALLRVLAAYIDDEAIGRSGKLSGTVHDCLFDLLMARFDVMQEHRKAILALARAIKSDKIALRVCLPVPMASACRLLDAAKVESKLPRPVTAAGLMAVCAWAFCVWQKDDSRDMAKTMAALDHGLRIAGKTAQFFTERVPV